MNTPDSPNLHVHIEARIPADKLHDLVTSVGDLAIDTPQLIADAPPQEVPNITAEGKFNPNLVTTMQNDQGEAVPVVSQEKFATFFPEEEQSQALRAIRALENAVNPRTKLREFDEEPFIQSTGFSGDPNILKAFAAITDEYGMTRRYLKAGGMPYLVEYLHNELRKRQQSPIRNLGPRALSFFRRASEHLIVPDDPEN